MQIGLYFCLRSCKYTKKNSHRHTTEFRLRKIQFQDACGATPLEAPASCFLNALVVTFSWTNRKILSADSQFPWSSPVCSLDVLWWHATGVFFTFATTTLTWTHPFVFISSAGGLRNNPSPAHTWWTTFGFGLPTLDYIDWGSTHTKLDLTSCAQTAQ